MVLIRPVQEGDLGAYAALRRRALAEEPLAFAASPETDVVVQIGKAPDWILFGAFDGELVGSAGLIRSRHPKAAHKMHLWGMYVAATHRRQGIATLLLEAAIAHARATPGVDWLQLGVTSDAAAAKRVYERAGFAVWGVEADALRYEGRAVVEEHMALRVR